MMFDGYPLVPGADGAVAQGTIAGDSCCTDPLCIDFCALACSFIEVLPSGPMWDRPKMEAMAYYNNSGTDPCLPACPPPFPCPTLVQHAIYVARKIMMIVEQVIWPAIREADPATATDTLDDWLEKLEWEDCFRTHCRSVLLGDLTPYELMGVCGPVYCPVDLPPALECAVKRGILIALTRVQRVGILNLAGINFIIEPLGAYIRPRNAPSGGGSPEEPPKCCSGMQFEICNLGDTIPGCLTGLPVCGPAGKSAEPVPAFVERGCDAPAGLPPVIWPGVIAAECIVRSLMPKACPSTIYRCC